MHCFYKDLIKQNKKILFDTFDMGAIMMTMMIQSVFFQNE